MKDLLGSNSDSIVSGQAQTLREAFALWQRDGEHNDRRHRGRSDA
jgi:hypothetical protein